MHPQPIKRLIDLFAKFPTVGPRSASRFVFYLLKIPQQNIDELLLAMNNLKKQIGICTWCFDPFSLAEQEKEEGLCKICANKTRDNSLLCLIEKESDLEALEKTKTFHGLYFILGGTVGQLKKSEIQTLRIEELKERIKNGKIQEVILATNLTTEGETTALYLERLLGPMGVRTTRLGRGLPIGGELEYADEETLRHALEGRK